MQTRGQRGSINVKETGPNLKNRRPTKSAMKKWEEFTTTSIFRRLDTAYSHLVC